MVLESFIMRGIRGKGRTVLVSCFNIFFCSRNADGHFPSGLSVQCHQLNSQISLPPERCLQSGNVKRDRGYSTVVEPFLSSLFHLEDEGEKIQVVTDLQHDRCNLCHAAVISKPINQLWNGAALSPRTSERRSHDSYPWKALIYAGGTGPRRVFQERTFRSMMTCKSSPSIYISNSKSAVSKFEPGLWRIMGQMQLVARRAVRCSLIYFFAHQIPRILVLKSN
ncbi:uncharacterized protein RBU33_017907 [Hipposideros larvatus]